MKALGPSLRKITKRRFSVDLTLTSPTTTTLVIQTNLQTRCSLFDPACYGFCAQIPNCFKFNLLVHPVTVHLPSLLLSNHVIMRADLDHLMVIIKTESNYLILSCSNLIERVVGKSMDSGGKRLRFESHPCHRLTILCK